MHQYHERMIVLKSNTCRFSICDGNLQPTEATVGLAWEMFLVSPQSSQQGAPFQQQDSYSLS